MKNIFSNSLFTLLSLASISLQAKENITLNITEPEGPLQQLTNNCSVGTAQTLLDISNVRTTILSSGDMWSDLSDVYRKGSYEVPKGSGKHSLFAGALWIGGYDDYGQLKVAGQTYRQSGTDYWPGPLDNVRLTSEGINNSKYGSTDASICAQYDQHFVILRSDVEEFVAWSNSDNPSLDYPDYVIPESILNYPGNRTTDDISNAYLGADLGIDTSGSYFYSLESLAPYEDVNSDGFYDPLSGDYPKYNINNSNTENDYLLGDQSVWWVFNDNGNVHTETGSETALGLEIQAQAFAFQTIDEDINNMTFYNYKMINRSHTPLNDTYFGVWVDPDLGDYQDDYVGCDVARGLGYCYNGDEDDGTAVGYGANPPAIGVDFFRGPLADENDGIDNNRDGVVDEPGEQIIMSKFVYYNNIPGSPSGNPAIAQDFYNYLDGKWLDNTLMTYGGDGRDQNNPACNYMFPGDTDPAFPGQTWNEQTAGNVPSDRRFLQTAGKFTLAPGAINTITTGVVWAQTNEGGVFASVEKMKIADDKAQELFDTNLFTQAGSTCAIITGCTNITAENYSPIANTDDGSCIIYGCTIPIFPNFNPVANIDDGLCDINSTDIYGCTNYLYMEYDSLANINNGTCMEVKVYGCIDSSYLEHWTYNENTYSISDLDDIPNVDDASCMNLIHFGCANPSYIEYWNYDHENMSITPIELHANVDDGSCLELIIEDCTDPSALNYNPSANVDDGSCIAEFPGCTDPYYAEFEAEANLDDGSCATIAYYGCTNPLYLEAWNLNYYTNYDGSTIWTLEEISNFNVDDGSCNYPIVQGCYDQDFIEYQEGINVYDFTCLTNKVYGCTDESYLEYWNYNLLPSGYYNVTTPININVNFNDGSCVTPIVIGCIYSQFTEFNPEVNTFDIDSCQTLTILGCNIESAINFDPSANTDDGTCQFEIEGCMDSEAFNYNVSANIEGECIPFIFGCTDPDAFNYDYNANSDDQSCISTILGCTNEMSFNFNPYANVDDGLCTPIIIGCMDNIYSNYNPNANISGECYDYDQHIDSLSNLVNVFSEQIAICQNNLASTEIEINLDPGWNMIGYWCSNSSNVTQVTIDLIDEIIILKDNFGNVYMPEFGFNGIGDFTPGYGYQIKVLNSISGYNICAY